VDSMSRQLKVLPNKVKSLFIPSGNFICVGETIFFNNFSKGANDYSWDFGDRSGISKLFNPKHIYKDSGDFMVKLTVNDGCGFDTSSVEMKVKPIPQFSINKSKAKVCVNDPVQFYAVLQDNGTIVWHFGDGDTSIYQNPTHTYLSAGPKYIYAVLKASNSICTNTQYDTIAVLPLPTITITADTNQACAYHLFNMTAKSAQTNIFNWDFGDSNTAAGNMVKHLYQFGGTFTVKMYAQTIDNCMDTAYKQLNVFPVPNSDFSYTPKDTCTGPVIVRFTNLSKGANNYIWDFGNGNTSSNIHPFTSYTHVGAYPIQFLKQKCIWLKLFVVFW
ncbi:MAG: PKD domain-containing protein, partial [Bacteroidetes bacterium]|nr:PKD domain-containing protein [Bacteroidota bacterium]